jgi:hypothetical protein
MQMINAFFSLLSSICATHGTAGAYMQTVQAHVAPELACQEKTVNSLCQAA